MKWSAEVTVGPLGESLASRLVATLLPESGDEGVPHTRTAVELLSGGVVQLRFRAETTSALRAALNAHLRWVQLALRVDGLSRRSPRT